MNKIDFILDQMGKDPEAAPPPDHIEYITQYIRRLENEHINFKHALEEIERFSSDGVSRRHAQNTLKKQGYNVDET